MNLPHQLQRILLKAIHGFHLKTEIKKYKTKRKSACQDYYEQFKSQSMFTVGGNLFQDTHFSSAQSLRYNDVATLSYTAECPNFSNTQKSLQCSINTKPFKIVNPGLWYLRSTVPIINIF